MALVRTRPYERSVKKLKASATDIEALEDAVVQYPEAGVVVPGLTGIRKLRFAMGGRGKRGGGRALYYAHVGGDIYMLLAFAKSAQADLMNDQRDVLLKLVAAIKD